MQPTPRSSQPPAAAADTEPRRRFLGRSAGLLAAGAAWPALSTAADTIAAPAGAAPLSVPLTVPSPVPSPAASFAASFAAPAPLVPMRASADRIIDIAVCTRPFRAQGPRIEVERIAGKTVVHNYGHGGSGWSLSWGAARAAVQLALSTHEPQLAVIGCGAIGLTSALVAQRNGLRVRIYCRERPPEVRSSAATGVWSPASRICTSAHATPAFRQQWETMARQSFRMYQSLLGLAGDPVEWCDSYGLSDLPFDQPLPATTASAGRHGNGEPDYPDLEEALPDIGTDAQLLQPHEHPFAVPHARRFTQMVFNLPAYQRLLMDDFLRNGGEILQRDFSSPRQFAGLHERTLIHATGYGARALLGDNSLVPVRGQTARLVPQADVRYGLGYRGHNLAVVPRRDGLLVQAQAAGDFGSEDTKPDRAASVAAVQRLAALFAPRS